MALARDGRILFLIKALVALIFLSKISFGSLFPVPYSFSYVIYQRGLHPYMNVLLCFLFGLPLLWIGLRTRALNHLSGFYRLFILALLSLLTVQTFLQMFFLSEEDSLFMQAAALASSIFMVVVYGWMIPRLWSLEEFLNFVQKWSGALVLLSLLLLPVMGGAAFKGGRFIGVFKHIPYMVSCATVAFVFSLATYLNADRRRTRIWCVLVLLGSFWAVVLTGTRSSAAAVVMALALTMILHKSRTNAGRIFKFAAVSFLLSFSLFFGLQTLEFAQGIATGQSSLGHRQAQDGVASRWEEIERGSVIFLKEPWLGHGLLSKFSSHGEVDVSNYNAMKDPHNIFISAGVIGGWPMLFLSGVALILMLMGALKALLSQDTSKRQLAVYLTVHIPILVIYHVHLSLGGMADRFYWLVFGFTAASLVVAGAKVRRPSTALN